MGISCLPWAKQEVSWAKQDACYLLQDTFTDSPSSRIYSSPAVASHSTCSLQRFLFQLIWWKPFIAFAIPHQPEGPLWDLDWTVLCSSLDDPGRLLPAPASWFVQRR